MKASSLPGSPIPSTSAPRRLAGVELPGDRRYVRDEETNLVWHRVEHRVLYADTDRSGSVYHANYLRFFEVGRAALLRDGNFPYSAVEESGYVYPIADLALKFRRPLGYDQAIWVHTRFQGIDYVAVTFDYVITHAGSSEVVCFGYTRHCATAEGHPRRVDPMTQRVFEEFPK